MSNYFEYIDKKFKDNKLTEDDKRSFLEIVSPIIAHEEFQKRLDNSLYPHHGKTSLGEHIISDAVMTYKLSKKKKKSDNKKAVLIAMFHDLYELPWQNSGRKEKRFTNKHGFIHPLEAAINAVTWYPNYFENKDDAKIIIDGIIHHMYPFPVRRIDSYDAELNNINKYNDLDDSIKEIIVNSSNRCKLGRVSFSRSKYLEGKLVSRADKLTTISSDKLSFSAYKALVTGKNKEL